jgi:hypothetical protein
MNTSAYLSYIWILIHPTSNCDVDSATLGKHPPPPPAVFLHAVPSRAEVSRAEPKHAGCYEAVNSSWQRCLTTPVNTTSGNKAAHEMTVARQSVNTVTTQQGNEPCFPLSDWGFIRVTRERVTSQLQSSIRRVTSEDWTRYEWAVRIELVSSMDWSPVATSWVVSSAWQWLQEKHLWHCRWQ